MGKTVALIEPSNHIGGLTSGGLGATDIGNKAAIGGISREFYQRLKTYYANDAVWKWQKPSEYKSPRQNDPQGDDARWTFEPHVAEIVLREMLYEANQIWSDNVNVTEMMFFMLIAYFVLVGVLVWWIMRSPTSSSPSTTNSSPSVVR